MDEDEKVRVSFSYPQEMRIELEKLAKKYRIKLMGYIKLIIKKEINLLKGRK